MNDRIATGRGVPAFGTATLMAPVLRRFGIGAKLLDRRLAAGLSQRQLAEASGIDQAEISCIERGQGNPTTQTLQALGGPLGVTLDFGRQDRRGVCGA